MLHTQIHPGLTAFMHLLTEVMNNTAKRQRPRKNSLKDHMTEATLRRIGSGIKPLQDLVLFSEGQYHTLEEAGASAQSMAILRDINGLSEPIPELYETRHLLQTLITTPPTGDDRPPDWTRWWNAAKEMHLYAHPQRGEKEGHDFQVLLQAVRALGQAALQHIPQYSDVLITGRYDKKQRPPAKTGRSLGGVVTNSAKIIGLAGAVLITGFQLTETPAGHVNLNDLPEDIDRHLQAQGIGTKRDIGTVTSDLQALKEALGGRTLDNIWTIERYDDGLMWYAKEVDNGHCLNVYGSLAFHVCSPRFDENDTVGPQELRLRFQATRERHTPIARISGNSPRNVAEFLNNPSGELTPPPPPALCPMASHCNTGCGRGQEDGTLTHPLTADHTPDSCIYHQFLAVHHRSPEALREAAAADVLASIARQEKAERKANRQKPAAANGLLQDPDEEYDDEYDDEDGDQGKEQGPRPTPKRSAVPELQPAAAASQQASLF